MVGVPNVYFKIGFGFKLMYMYWLPVKMTSRECGFKNLQKSIVDFLCLAISNQTFGNQTQSNTKRSIGFSKDKIYWLPPPCAFASKAKRAWILARDGLGVWSASGGIGKNGG